MIKVNGITCRALLDTGAGSSLHIIDFRPRIEETTNTDRLQTDRNYVAYDQYSDRYLRHGNNKNKKMILPSTRKPAKSIKQS